MPDVSTSADDIIQIFLVNRHTGVAVFRYDFFHLPVRGLRVNGNHVDAGTDDIYRVDIAETDNSLENVLFLVD